MTSDAEKIRVLREALDYVIERTYCGADAEWHFKPGYDPQIALDALSTTAPAPCDDSVPGETADRVEHSEIWLTPQCDDDCERTWCQDDCGPCPDCGREWIRYVLAPQPAAGEGGE